MSKVFKLTLVATMAELVWHVVAGMRVDKLFVIDSAGSTGSTAPSRRHLRSLDIPFLVIFAFVVEQTVSLKSIFLLTRLQFVGSQFLLLWWVRGRHAVPGPLAPGSQLLWGSPSLSAELGACEFVCVCVCVEFA